MRQYAAALGGATVEARSVGASRTIPGSSTICAVLPRTWARRERSRLTVPSIHRALMPGQGEVGTVDRVCQHHTARYARRARLADLFKRDLRLVLNAIALGTSAFLRRAASSVHCFAR